MTTLIQQTNYLFVQTDYQTPSVHKHLASHVIISLEGIQTWNIEGSKVCCRGICIAPEVTHSMEKQSEKMLVFLFPEISNYGRYLTEAMLKDTSYFVLEDSVVDQIIQVTKQSERVTEQKCEEILSLCGIDRSMHYEYEQRIQWVLAYVRQLETIEPEIMEELCNLVYLSKSRLSHLFKKETTMSLHSYLAFEKIRKAHRYYTEGLSITESCLKAGFSSSSHFAATSKRMFGISMRDVYKTIAGK